MAVYVSNYSSSQQQVSWDAPGGAYTHTQLQRSTNGGGYVTVTISGMAWFPIGTRLVRVNCSSGSSYRYRVQFRFQSMPSYYEYSAYSYSATLTFHPPGGGYVPPDPDPPSPPAPTYNPPSNLKITSLSDTSIKLSWQNNDSYPYTVLNTYINGVFKDDRWFTGNPSSFTDTLHPAANRLMQYQLLVVFNPGPGETYKYSNSVIIRTTPAAPVSALVEKLAGGAGIKASWGRPANWDKAWQWIDVQRQDNISGSWMELATGLAPDTTTIEDYDIIRSRQYRYRIRARANTGSFERVSAWATTGYIRLLSLPVNVGGAWKDLDGAWVNVGGEYKNIDGAWVNVGGVWVPA